MEYTIESTIGNIIPKPEVVAELRDNGYYVISDAMMHRLLREEMELIKFKERVKRGELLDSKNLT